MRCVRLAVYQPAHDRSMHAQMHLGQTLVAKVDINAVHLEAETLGGKYSNSVHKDALRCRSSIFWKGSTKLE